MTLLPPSEKKLNAGEIIGSIIDRFRIGAGWNLKAEDTPEKQNERKQLIAVFLEDLGAARVPVEEYERLYRRAKVSRARRKMEGENVSYHLQPEELVTEWLLLEKERAAGTTEKPGISPENCPEKHEHVLEDGLVKREYVFAGVEPIHVACHVCQRKAHDLQVANWRQKHNEKVRSKWLAPAPEDESPRAEVAEPKAVPFTPDFPLTEAEDLRVVHNRLVLQLSDSPETANLAYVIWDEGAQVFKHRHSAYKTFTPDALKKAIARYQEILDKKGVA